MNKKKITSFVSSINIIVALILINVLLGFYPYLKFDFSQNKVHSLSPASKEIVKNLDDIVTVKVFASQELPANIKPIASNLKTILEEYSKLNRGKFKVVYLDPSKDSAAKDEASKLGIQQLQFSSLKSDKFEVSTGFLGLAITYGDKRNVLPVAGDVGNLEYFIDSGIKQVLRKSTPLVAIAESGGVDSTQIQYFRKYLEQNYKISNVTLNGDSTLPQEADSLVVVGQPGKLDDKGLVKVKNWIDSNKGFIGFLDQVNINSNMTGQANPDSGLEAILKEKGFDLQKNLVLDSSSALANFNTKSGAFLVKYPYWVKIRPENVNNDIPAVSGINAVMIPWSSSIKISGDVKPLFSSSKDSIAVTDFSNLTPTNSQAFNVGDKNNNVLAAVNTKNNRIAIIANSNFIKDQFLGESEQNLYLALNLVDYFSQDQSLLSIRSKDISTNPLNNISDNQKAAVRWINIALPVVLLLGFAVGANIIRKRKNKSWN